MVLCSPHFIFIEWGVAVFALRGAPFWSQSFRFAQTDGIREQYATNYCDLYCDMTSLLTFIQITMGFNIYEIF